jgi:hypothetical protein
MVVPVIVVIDNIQTTWLQFGCFVAASNTFVFGISLQRHLNHLFHAGRFFSSFIPIWSPDLPRGSVSGTTLAEM